ncbi:MAG TPA: pilus assembly protein TadG-related protein [Novosphingobium sp.]|nr:pilus assembly protein TadG-related protein [Novosphingobium sp.]
MLNTIRRTMRNLRSHTCGNATLLVALGMPALIGGAGLAVDTAQWYMWKRELQFAVDQAALAGAWARTKTSTQSTYITRARQEFTGNLATTKTIAGTATVALANFANGVQNSVTVRGSATRRLPFSSLLTSRAVTVTAYAQASFEEGNTYTSCLIALDPDDSGAFVIGGNARLAAGCGIAALSNSPTSITINGNPTVDPGWVISKGGIDDWFDTHTNAEIHEYMSGLVDPFASLTPPNNTTARAYSCSAATSGTPASTTTKATVATRTITTYIYKRGANATSATVITPAYTGTGYHANTDTTATQTNVTVANGTTASTQNGTPTTTNTQVAGSGNAKIFEFKTVTVNITNSNVVATTTPAVPGAPAQASLLPGTYSSIDTSCATVLQSGVYVINGGSLKINAQHNFTGSGVMFVLKGGADITINGGANVNLTAMSQAQLEATGLTATQAAPLVGMLIFEARNSTARKTANKINGNATTYLNGTIYLPNSDVSFSGTAGVTSQCLMIAAANITIQGNADMSTFCPPGVSEDSIVSTGVPSVKLVA